VVIFRCQSGEGNNEQSMCTVPGGPSIVPTHSKRFASVFGKADYRRAHVSRQGPGKEIERTMPGEDDI
jgi:hypothetical protein